MSSRGVLRRSDRSGKILWTGSRCKVQEPCSLYGRDGAERKEERDVKKRERECLGTPQYLCKRIRYNPATRVAYSLRSTQEYLVSDVGSVLQAGLLCSRVYVGKENTMQECARQKLDRKEYFTW